VWVANETDGNGNPSVAITKFSEGNGYRPINIRGMAYGFNGPDALAVVGASLWVANSDGDSMTVTPIG